MNFTRDTYSMHAVSLAADHLSIRLFAILQVPTGLAKCVLLGTCAQHERTFVRRKLTIVTSATSLLLKEASEHVVKSATGTYAVPVSSQLHNHLPGIR